MSDGQTVYYIWNEWFDKFWSVKCENREIGKLYGSGSQDTVGTIEPRMQDQLDIPVSRVTMIQSCLVEIGFYITNVINFWILLPHMHGDINKFC